MVGKVFNHRRGDAGKSLGLRASIKYIEVRVNEHPE